MFDILQRLTDHHQTRQGQRRLRMATVETLEGRTIPSNVVTSFTHDAITAQCDQWPATEGFWRRFLSRQAWGPRSTEVLSTGWAGRGVTEASPSQW